MRLGISRCLLGESVRYNGGHKLDIFLVKTFGKYVEYVPVCPEVECGMSIPREPLRLERNLESIRLITHQTKKDYTQQMTCWASNRLNKFKHENISGFIFKEKSPSCGMDVKIYNKKSRVKDSGAGIFAGMFMENFPLIPIEDEDRLYDPACRENFIERIFVQHRWRNAIQKKTLENLVDFHTRHKMIILAHSEKHYRVMGKLVANTGDIPVQELYEQYQRILIDALSIQSTLAKNVNVLQHIIGYFKKQLSDKEKQYLYETIENYRNGEVPIIVLLTLINHYVRKYDQPYLKSQYYLNPDPIELLLKNHV